VTAPLLGSLAPLLDDVTLDAPWALIERFSTLKREHPDDVRTAAREIVQRLETFGVPVTVHEPEIYLSLPGKASVQGGGTSFRAKPLAMSRAVPKGLTAPLVFAPTAFDPNTDQVITSPVGGDVDLDLRGKLVLAHGFGMSSMALHFEQRGALGLIAVHPGKHPHWGICSTIWGSPDLHDLPRKPSFVVVSVNHADGLALIEQAKQGGTATVFAELEEGWYPSPIPVVTIPGTEEPDKYVLLHGHYDSWDVGVGDNAVGDATMLEIARVLWKHRSQLKRSVRIAWWPGHSTGRYAGSTWFADHYGIDLYEHCIAQVNCDSPGCRWAAEYLDVSWMAETEDWAKAALSGGRLLVQQHRAVLVFHAAQHHAAGTARGEGVLRGRWLRREHRLAHRGGHDGDRRSRHPPDRHQDLPGRGGRRCQCDHRPIRLPEDGG
jgi:N-acetylated-alpha-linked acidic dipeptidase